MSGQNECKDIKAEVSKRSFVDPLSLSRVKQDMSKAEISE